LGEVGLTAAPVPQTSAETLADLLVELNQRIRTLIEGLSQVELYWRPDPGANSVGVTVWHFTRWLDVVSVRLLDGLGSDDELWFANGWAKLTRYDPRGLGEGGLGVLTGYTLAEVSGVPQLSSAQLIEYQEQVVARLHQRLLEFPLTELAADAVGVEVMSARAEATGRKNTYGWLKLILMGSFQHAGEVAALLAMRERLEWHRSHR
jgi:hypothetical protein